MEHSLISRRVRWACAGDVDVAPNWPLGKPPSHVTYLLPQHYLCLYLRAARDTDLKLSRDDDDYPLMFYADEDDEVLRRRFWWLDLLHEDIVKWKNFQYRRLVRGRRPPTSIDILIFYHRLYLEFVMDLWPQIK